MKMIQQKTKSTIEKTTQRSYPLIKGFVILFIFSQLSACSGPSIQKLEGAAQGTTYHISYWSKTALDNVVIANAVKNELDAIDKTLSNYRPDSVIEVFNSTENTDSQEVGAEIVKLVRIAQTVSVATQGCYDLTMKPLFDLWGFRGEAPAMPDEAVIHKLQARIGMAKLDIIDDSHLRKQQADLKVDLSSIAQGYSVGEISRVLEEQGITDYLVEIGGELQTRGFKPDQQPWRIALERPLPGDMHMQKRITMPKDTQMAVMTSGTYNHYFDFQGQRYSHILDARNGRPITHNLVSVTVIHEDPTIADAWDTALLCLGQKDGLQAANLAHIPALFIQQQGTELIESKSDALNALDKITIE
jgi:thiamine biosynthesis lipoprotein